MISFSIFNYFFSIVDKWIRHVDDTVLHCHLCCSGGPQEAGLWQVLWYLECWYGFIRANCVFSFDLFRRTGVIMYTLLCGHAPFAIVPSDTHEHILHRISTVFRLLLTVIVNVLNSPLHSKTLISATTSGPKSVHSAASMRLLSYCQSHCQSWPNVVPACYRTCWTWTRTIASTRATSSNTNGCTWMHHCPRSLLPSAPSQCTQSQQSTPWSRYLKLGLKSIQLYWPSILFQAVINPAPQVSLQPVAFGGVASRYAAVMRISIQKVTLFLW